MLQTAGVLRLSLKPYPRTGPAPEVWQPLPVLPMLLVLLPAALFVQGMLEHYLFVDSYSILNFLFFLFSGYVVRLSRQVSWKQAFPMLARRKKA